MSLYHTIRKRLGKDTTDTVERSDALYRYSVELINGKIVEFLANRHVKDEGFATFYRYQSARLWTGVGVKVWPIDTRVEELGSIAEINREKVGDTHIEIEFDKSNCEELNTEIGVRK